MKAKPCRKSFGSNRAGKVFLNGSPCLSQLPCFTLCLDVPLGLGHVLFSGVPMGGQGSWGQPPGTHSNAVNSPDVATCPVALLWVVIVYMGSDRILPAVGVSVMPS